MPTRKKPGPTQRDEHEEPIEERLDTQTIALRIIAGLLLVAQPIFSRACLFRSSWPCF